MHQLKYLFSCSRFNYSEFLCGLIGLNSEVDIGLRGPLFYFCNNVLRFWIQVVFQNPDGIAKFLSKIHTQQMDAMKNIRIHFAIPSDKRFQGANTRCSFSYTCNNLFLLYFRKQNINLDSPRFPFFRVHRRLQQLFQILTSKVYSLLLTLLYKTLPEQRGYLKTIVCNQVE